MPAYSPAQTGLMPGSEKRPFAARPASAVTIKSAAGTPGAGDGDVAMPSRIVAKGEGTLAEQILTLAFAAGVKVREDADLVEILEAIEIDTEVPLHALAAVAEILSYVYRANTAAADLPTPQTDLEP